MPDTSSTPQPDAISELFPGYWDDLVRDLLATLRALKENVDAMPKRYTPTARETVDLHAPWWSTATDAESGRYLERAVIFTKLLHSDQQWLQSRITQLLGDQEIDLAGITSADQATGMLPKISASDLFAVSNTDDSLLRLVVEITDADGAPLPWRDPNGNLLEEAAKQTLAEMDDADVQFILTEVNKRIQVQPVPVLAADRQAAQDGDPAAANGRGAQGVAEAAFRGAGEPGLS